MPKLGGAELARMLATTRRTPRSSTCPATPTARYGWRHADLGPVLQKPFTPRQLLDWIRDALRAKAA